MSCYGSCDEYPIKWRNEVKNWFKDNCENRVKVINPTDFYQIGKAYHNTEREVKLFDLYNVEHSDILLINLRHINSSFGTAQEMCLANRLNHPIIGFLDNDDIDNIIHPWAIDDCCRIETGKNAMLKAMQYIKDYYIDC